MTIYLGQRPNYHNCGNQGSGPRRVRARAKCPMVGNFRLSTRAQTRADSEGANAVVNIVSYYKKNVFSSPTEYECHAGAFVTGVALKGMFVKTK